MGMCGGVAMVLLDTHWWSSGKRPQRPSAMDTLRPGQRSHHGHETEGLERLQRQRRRLHQDLARDRTVEFLLDLHVTGSYPTKRFAGWFHIHGVQRRKRLLLRYRRRDLSG